CKFGQRFDLFRADAADNDLESSVFAGSEKLQLVEDRDLFPIQFPKTVRRAVVEQQVAEAMLRLRQRDAIYDRPRRIDPPAPDHFGLLVWIDSDRGEADLHLDRAFAFGDFDSEPIPCAARLGPISERRRRDSQIPPGVPLRRGERDGLLITAQRFPPVALLLAQQPEVVPGRRPRGPELGRFFVILDRLGDQAALLELDGLLVVADRKRLRLLTEVMDFHFSFRKTSRGSRIEDREWNNDIRCDLRSSLLDPRSSIFHPRRRPRSSSVLRRPDRAGDDCKPRVR